MTVRVVVPYVPGRLRPETALALTGVAYEAVDVSSDDEAYYRMVAGLWRSGEDFALVEQDIAPPPGAVAALDACPEGWCGFAYPLNGNLGVWFGCTRFRAAFTEAEPDLPDYVRDRRWRSLDSAWTNWLRRLGHQEAHWHWPAAEHAGHAVAALRSATAFLNCACGQPVVPAVHARCPRCGRVVDGAVVARTPTDVTL